MQVIIFNERFFYKKILSSTQKEIKEIIETKDNFYTIKKIPKKMEYELLHVLKKTHRLQKSKKVYK